MQNIALSLNIKALNQYYNSQGENQIHERRTGQNNDSGPQIFRFGISKPIEEQIDAFQVTKKKVYSIQFAVATGGWNGKIEFEGFKGAFKLEFWTMFEEAFRSLDSSSLKKIIFMNTKLAGEHLTLLLSLILWIKPKELSLEFKQNELDDKDLEEFLLDGILDRFAKIIYSFEVISNPGVFKGNMLQMVKQKLNHLSQVTEFDYKFYKNKENKSFAFIRLDKQSQPQNLDTLITKFNNKMKESFYYKLSFRNVFTQSNYKGLYYLLEQTYHDDKLEQLEYIDISGSSIVETAKFQALCQRISTSKGLLSLGLGNMPIFKDDSIVQTLMGDRYDKLRLNHLDISDQQELVEKCMQIFADNLIGPSLKSLTWNGTMGQHLPVLVKIMYICAAVERQIEKLKAISKKKGYFVKLNMKELDLAQVENYNRHDLAERLADCLIFNEYSNVRKLVLQNYDVGRLEAYLKSCKKFRKHIEDMKKLYPSLYSNFKSKLYSITLPYQNYRMENDPYLKLFEEIIFSKVGDIFEIREFSMRSCFNQSERKEGFLLFLKSLEKTYETSPDVQFTLKSISFQDCSFYSYEVWKKIFDNIVFNEHFGIEEFKLQSQEVDCSDWLNSPQQLIKGLKPDQFCCLKKLIFNDVRQLSLQIYTFIDLFIYNPKFRIEELELTEISISDDGIEAEESLKKKAKELDKPLNLKTLKIISIRSPDVMINKNILEYLVLNKNSSVVNLEINNLLLTNMIPLLYDKVISLEKEGFMVLSTLKNFVFQFYDQYTNEEWQKLCEIFIWNKRVLLTSLKFKSFVLTKEFEYGFELSYQKLCEIIANDQSMMNKFKFHLTELTFEDCEFQAEFLAILFSSLMCKIEKFNLISCRGVEFALEELKKELQKADTDIKNILTMSLTELSLDRTQFSEIQIFEWFIRHIVMSKERQRITKMSLEGCGLQDQYMDVINTVLKELKDYQSEQNFSKYFSIRDFNFNLNPGISTKQWKTFVNNIFTVYDEYSDDEEETKQQQDKDRDENVADMVDQEKNDQKENISDETSLILFNQKFNIEKKILETPQLFQLSPPKQLRIIELSLKFEFETEETKKDLYARIMKGLLFFPESQVEEASFKNVDMQHFTDSVANGLIYLDQYYQNSKMLFQGFPLKKLSLSDITLNTDQNIQLFISQFFENKKMNLSALIINSYLNENILKKIINVISQHIQEARQIFLEELVLENVQEDLSDEETVKFFQTLVFNANVPMKKISLGGSINLPPPSDLRKRIENFLSKQNVQVELRELKVELVYESSTETYRKILPLLFDSKYSKLEKFICNKNDQRFPILKEVKMEEVVNIKTLKEIEIPNLELDNKILELIYRLRPYLKQATFYQITQGEWDNNLIDLFLNINSQRVEQFEKCVLNFSVDLNNIDRFSPDILNKFVFHPVFSWNSVVTEKGKNSIDLFSNFSKVNFQDQIAHLQVLKLDMNLVFTSWEELSGDGLELIAKHLIYNEKSNLKELVLYQCHLKPKQIKSLTSPANDFREKIKQEKLQHKTHLKLERLSLYYSLYLGQEGAEMICNDLVFFEYITVKRIDFEVLNWNDDNQSAFNQAAKNWLKFQAEHKRPSAQNFQLEYLDWGRNEFVQSKKVWDEMCDLFIFSDLTPKLTDLYIHFMSLQDIQVEYICEKANSYFMWKPFNYIHPLKRLNFCLNTALSHIGWRQISKEFFFEKHIRLEELNLVSTMIDSEQKINAILDVMKWRAQQEKNKKLPLHTLYCYNISIKSNILEFLSEKPADYKSNIDECMVEIEKDATNLGYINGIPVSFGQLQSIINKTIYQSKQFVNTNYFEEESSVRFSPYHLDIVQGFLKPLNNLFQGQPLLEYSLPINLKTIDQLCAMFQYRRYEGDPYPLQIFFDQKAVDFYNSKECQIREIKIVGVNLKSQELVTQQHVFEFWELVNSNKNTIDRIKIDYKCDDDLVDLMFSQGYSERDLVNLLRLFPPSSIRFQKILSLQAIKGIYSIMWDVDHFQYSNILVDKDIFLNMGIGYSLREYVYSSNPKLIILRCLKRTFYKFFDLFVSSVSKYEFSDQVKDLNNFLATQNIAFYLFILLTLIFYAVCIFAPFLSTYYSSRTYTDICFKGISPNGQYIYAGFAALFLFSEFMLFRKITHIIPKHLNLEEVVQESKKKTLKDKKIKYNKTSIEPKENEKEAVKIHSDIDPEKQGLTKKLTATTSKIFYDLNVLSQSKTVRKSQVYIALFQGQLAKYDFFNDISFILTCFYCEEKGLFYAAVVVTAFNVMVHLYTLIDMLLARVMEGNKNAKQLSTKYINDFFTVSIIGRNIALAQILDQVAPFNVTVLPNNIIAKSLMPQLAGKSISNSVRSYLLKFTFEDMPQIILQIIFLIVISAKHGNQNGTGGISISSIITIANASLSLLISFIKFMSIRPSSLTQQDFDELANKKKKRILDINIEELKKEQEIMKALNHVQNDEKRLMIQDEEVSNLLIP